MRSSSSVQQHQGKWVRYGKPLVDTRDFEVRSGRRAGRVHTGADDRSAGSRARSGDFAGVDLPAAAWGCNADRSRSLSIPLCDVAVGFLRIVVLIFVAWLATGLILYYSKRR